MTERSKTLLDTAAYIEALEFARSLRDPSKPLEFPNYAEYVRLVAERAVIDLEACEAEMNDFQELPEPFELAYLTVRLERLQARIREQNNIDVRSL